MKEMMVALEAAAQKKQVMAVYRDDTGDSWSGIPVMTGPALVVLARERDFTLDRWCIAECTNEEEGELYFYVGKVESLEKNHFTIRPVNAEGGWIKEPVAIPYEDLCTVGFGGNYVRIYQKYTKGR